MTKRFTNNPQLTIQSLFAGSTKYTDADSVAVKQ